MAKIEAKKDGQGNIIIAEDSFEILLGCLDNQKFVGEPPQNGDSLSTGKKAYYETQNEIQKAIDDYSRECRKILHQSLIIETKEDGYYLIKRYEHQEEIINWTWEEVLEIRKLFKEEWLIERHVFTSEGYLTISEDGENNRPWEEEEIHLIRNTLGAEIQLSPKGELLREKYILPT